MGNSLLLEWTSIYYLTFYTITTSAGKEKAECEGDKSAILVLFQRERPRPEPGTNFGEALSARDRSSALIVL